MFNRIKELLLQQSGAYRFSAEKRKNIGEFMLLGSSLAILPLLFLKDPGIVTKVVLQLIWALVIAAGFLLVSSTKTKN